MSDHARHCARALALHADGACPHAENTCTGDEAGALKRLSRATRAIYGELTERHPPWGGANDFSAGIGSALAYDIALCVPIDAAVDFLGASTDVAARAPTLFGLPVAEQPVQYAVGQRPSRTAGAGRIAVEALYANTAAAESAARDSYGALCTPFTAEMPDSTRTIYVSNTSILRSAPEMFERMRGISDAWGEPPVIRPSGGAEMFTAALMLELGRAATCAAIPFLRAETVIPACAALVQMGAEQLASVALRAILFGEYATNYALQLGMPKSAIPHAIGAIAGIAAHARAGEGAERKGLGGAAMLSALRHLAASLGNQMLRIDHPITADDVGGVGKDGLGIARALCAHCQTSARGGGGDGIVSAAKMMLRNQEMFFESLLGAGEPGWAPLDADEQQEDAEEPAPGGSERKRARAEA